MPMTTDMHPDDNLYAALPLTEATFFILLSLAPGAKHGYAILKDVSYLSQQRVKLSTSTLYGALKRLLTTGWIDRLDEPSPDDTTRTPKAYVLTERGRRMLGAETTRLRSLVRAAEQQPAAEGI
jgi:DNA-binding PadR family transcriptional regulator